MDDDVERSEGERINILLDFIKDKLSSGPITLADEKSILTEAERLEITNKAPIVLCELLLDEKILHQVRFNLRYNLVSNNCMRNLFYRSNSIRGCSCASRMKTKRPKST